jgi:alkylation response protein AidB-like acyl-CoA dehydrogenase
LRPREAFPPWSEAHESFRRRLRAFLEAEVAPHAREWDRAGSFPRELFKKFADLGVFALRHAPEHGGKGLDYWYVVALAEELVHSKNAGVNLAMVLQGEMATPVIGALGTDEQKRELLAPALRGDKIAALAITEPGTGSDVSGIATTARREGSDFVVSGEKKWIGNGTRADFITLAVRTATSRYGGLSLLTFPTDTRGFEVMGKLDKIGLRAIDNAILRFDGCRVPARYLLGEENRGLTYIMENFQSERLIAALLSVAESQRLIADAIAYGGQRVAFGKPIVKLPVWRHKLAEHLSAVEAARWLCYRAADLFDRGQPAVKEISMAKLVACDLLQRVAYDCLQLHGAMGYCTETDVARAWQDARMMTIGGGTSEIMKEIVASKVAGL